MVQFLINKRGRKKMDAPSLFTDRESQIAAIEKTYEAKVNKSEIVVRKYLLN